MKKIVFFIISFVIFGMGVNAQRMQIRKQIENVPPDKFINQKLFSLKTATTAKTASLEKHVRSFDLLEINTSTLSKIANTKATALQIDIPMKRGSLTIQLVKSNVINEQTVFSTSNNSRKTQIKYNTGAYYYGIIKDKPNTMVSISFFENNIVGVIASTDGNYVLGKSDKSNRSNTEYIMYNDKDLLMSNTFECQAADALPQIPIEPDHGVKMENRCEGDVAVRTYIETDLQLYANQGNSETNVLDYVTGLFNITSTLYANESINAVISEVNVWTEADPYVSATNTGEALGIFRDEMNAGFNGNIAHLFSARSLGGGIAYVNILCNPDSGFKTAVSASLTNTITPFPTYSWNGMVVTHEMGHNLGSPHTQNCSWNGDNTAIDGCFNPEGDCERPPIPAEGGTVMSYCHLTSVGINLNLGFGPQPGDLIRNRVTNADCLTNCACDVNLVITNDVTSGATDIQEASNTIIATNTIRVNAVARYNAGQKVTLKPGFRALRGSRFYAYKEDCSRGSNEEITAISAVSYDATTSENQEDQISHQQFTAFPNPFSDIVNFEYQVTQNNSPVILKIYNILGKEVETLVNKERETKGNYRLKFDGTDFPEGIYLYRLEIGETVKTGKIVLKRS